MNEATLVRELAVGPNESVSCDGGSVGFDTQDISDDLLCVLVEFWMEEGDVVIAGNAVAKG